MGYYKVGVDLGSVSSTNVSSLKYFFLIEIDFTN